MRLGRVTYCFIKIFAMTSSSTNSSKAKTQFMSWSLLLGNLEYKVRSPSVRQSSSGFIPLFSSILMMEPVINVKTRQLLRLNRPLRDLLYNQNYLTSFIGRLGRNLQSCRFGLKLSGVFWTIFKKLQCKNSHLPLLSAWIFWLPCQGLTHL